MSESCNHIYLIRLLLVYTTIYHEGVCGLGDGTDHITDSITQTRLVYQICSDLVGLCCLHLSASIPATDYTAVTLLMMTSVYSFSDF